MTIEELEHEKNDTYRYKIDGEEFVLKFINGQFKKCSFNVGGRDFYNKEDWQRFSKIADIIDDIERQLQLEEL